MKYNIQGDSTPVVICELEAGESMITESGSMVWMSPNMEMQTSGGGSLGKAFGRMFSGESLFLSYYTAQGPAEIAFASSFPGRIAVKELAPGESLICQKSSFLCATYGVELSVHFQKKLGAGFLGGEGFIMQKVTGPGLVFLELDGYCPEYYLNPGERLVCDTGVVAYMDASCQIDVQMVKGLKNIFFGGEGLFDTVVTGPGKVCLQTMSIAKLAGLLGPFSSN